jgi:hypothetical protein
MRPLPVTQTGQPASYHEVLPAYCAALVAWTAATVVLVLAAPELVAGAVTSAEPVLAAHLVGVVFFPLAVAAAVWQLLPVMLRNDLGPPARRRLALVAVAAGGPLTAAAVALDETAVVALGAALLAGGLLLVLGEVAVLIHRAPRGKVIVVDRAALALGGANAALAFALGAVAAADGGPEPLGVAYERFLLIHLSLALLGWLTVLIAAVGRTLVPMLGLAAASSVRRVPVAELVVVGGLWLYSAGLAAPSDGLVASGIVLMACGFAPVALLFARVAVRGRLGLREGPVAHVAAGLILLLEAAVLGLGASTGLIAGRGAAIAAVVLLGLGWAAGVVLGHLGKLVSLSGWGSWPPGPRPKQADLYPRRVWQVEAVLFAVGVQALAVGIVLESEAVARAGALALVAAAAAALVGAATTVRRVAALGGGG